MWLPMKRFVDEALEGSEGERSWAEVKEATMQMAKQLLGTNREMGKPNGGEMGFPNVLIKSNQCHY